MRKRLAATAAIVVFAISGCTSEPTSQREHVAQITVEGSTQEARTVSCSQTGWLLTIEAATDAAHARAFLRLDEERPAVENVTLNNVDGFDGLAGQGVGSVEASAANGIYTITGTAEGAHRDSAATPRTAPFRIEVPC
jgi:ipoprotein LpqH